MGRIIYYGSFGIIIVIGSYYYFEGGNLPDILSPIVVLVFSILIFGKSKKAKEEGEIFAVSRSIKRDKNPTIFKIIIYINYLLSAGLLIWGIYLFF